jgi:hypothetical protein
MSDANLPQDPAGGLSRDDMLSVLFANMVMQQTQMTLMFLGRVPHPESGKPVTDLDAARMFIDQMEMLEVKTKGNLTSQEDALLRQSLATVRMAFVETVDHPASSEEPKPQPAQQEQAPAPPGAAAAGAEAESPKKFSKKY